MADKKAPFAVSRRAVIGAASATPLLAEARSGSSPDEAVKRCDEWLALDAEVDRLVRRWSDLEGLLIEEKRWASMSPDQRVALRLTNEMDRIDRQLELMFEQRRELLDELSKLSARNLQGVSKKLLVVLAVMQHERGDYYKLFASAVAELKQVRCAGCGASLLP